MSVPRSPAAQILLPELPHTRYRSAVTPLAESVMAPAGSMRKTVPPSPTIQIGPLGTPHRSCRSAVPRVCAVTVVPSQWMIVPPDPTAHRSVADVPQALSREYTGPESTVLSAVPFHLNLRRPEQREEIQDDL
ncbi:MAG TPA: hypothetical protein PLW65_32120, partial [Pseudomonadota bacterium]|nr:hypothetical protein [Pseudomonadota bacterium]